MNRRVDPPNHAVREAVERALAEDLTPLGDLTSSLVPADATASGAVVAREPGVIAGSACFSGTYGAIDPAVHLKWHVFDGDRVEEGQSVVMVEGPLTSVLTGERTALNFLGHLSGIATTVARYVAAAESSGDGRTRIWDTRKTTPGLRALEKAAVRAGGAVNHRGNLSEWVLLKDNHLVGVSIIDAVRTARDHWPGRTVHVECDSLAQVNEALAAGADALLLDNMILDDVREAVIRRDASGARCLLEASGGITLSTVPAYAAAGVDMISVGAITNSAPVLDLGLDIRAEPV